MKNGYKTTSDLPKAEVEDTVKLTKSELNAVVNTAFVMGMLFSGAVIALLTMVVDIIKAILN